MSTVKISELSDIPGGLNANTSNSLFLGVDIPTGVTGKFTATQLAERLYANNALAVGENQIIFSNTIAQFSGFDPTFLQTNMQNFESTGSGDYVITGDQGTNSNNFIDLGLNGSAFEVNATVGTAFLPNDGYLYITGPGPDNQGNLLIGTTTTGTVINFIVGGANTENIVAHVDSTGIHSSSITSAISVANTWLQSNDHTTLVAAEGYTDTANTKMKSYVDTANTSLKSYADNTFLANTSGTFGGNLVVAGRANVTQQMMIANSSYDYTNTALVKIVGSAGALTQPPANPGYMLQITGIDGVSSRVVNSAYGTGAYALFAGRKGNGTAGSPTAVQADDVIARFSGSGYNGSAFTTTGQGRIDIVAAENFTTANTGSRIEFYNTIPQTNTVTKIATFNADTATFTGALYPNKGFIYSPRVLAGNTTSLVIDFSTDSMVKMQCNADCTVSFTNYIPGKVVEVWMTNVSGSQHTVTHGCSSTNATNNGTTKALPATSSIYLRYFSIDGDLANTFVAVTQG